MKKICICLVCLMVLASLAPMAMAAGSASLSGPDAVRAGDTITLTFYAGGGIHGGSCNVSYDSSQLTLQGYSAAIGGSWAVEFGGNHVVFYDNSMASPISSSSIFRATFKVADSLPAGTTISVSVNGITLSDGQQDMGMGSRTYSTTILPPLSGDCDLASLTVSGATISPAFDPAVVNYTASVPFTTASLGVQGTASHAGAKVAVNNPGLTAGGTTALSVTVTAENGAVKTYTIRVTRAQDPNYVPSGNTKLKQLAVEGWQLSPAFDPAVTQYYVWLPYETETVSMSAAPEDSKATVSIADIGTLTAGMAKDVAVTVTAENGTKLDYVVTVIRAPIHSETNDFLAGVRETVPTEPEETVPPTIEEVVVTEPVETTVPVEVQEPAAENENSMVMALVITGVAGLIVGAVLALTIRALTVKRKVAV